MLEVVVALRENKYAIESEHEQNRFDTVDSIAVRFGYDHEGTFPDVTFFGRRVPYDNALMRRIYRGLQEEGYALQDRDLTLRGFPMEWKVIGEKHYERGGTAVMERGNIDSRDLILIVGRTGEKTIIGLPLDPKPELVSVMDNVAGHLNMRPRYNNEPIEDKGKRRADQDEKDAFERLLGGNLEIDI